MIVHEKMRGQMSKGSAGVGWVRAKFKAQSTEKEERQAILRVFKEIAEEHRVVNVISNLHDYGEWVRWEAAMQLDKKWHSLLACSSDTMFKARMLFTEDEAPTPSNLRRSNRGDGKCPFGCTATGSLLHILCGCRHSLKEKPQSRITWRHDSVLYAIFISV